MPHNIRRYTGLFAHQGLLRAHQSAAAAATRRVASLLEAQGRGGDRHLVHVSDGELAVIRRAFGPRGHEGWRNPVTGLESFAPDDGDSINTEPIGGTFAGANSDGPSYTIRLPSDNFDPAAAGFDTLREIGSGNNWPAERHDADAASSGMSAEDSWGTVARKGLENSWPALKGSIGGLARAAGEALSAQPAIPPEVGMPDATVQGYAPRVAQDLADWGARLHDNAPADLRANAPNVDSSSAKSFAYEVVSALPQMAVLLASAATGTTLPAMGALALQGFGSRYGDARQQGRTAAQASRRCGSACGRNEPAGRDTGRYAHAARRHFPRPHPRTDGRRRRARCAHAGARRGLCERHHRHRY